MELGHRVMNEQVSVFQIIRNPFQMLACLGVLSAT